MIFDLHVPENNLNDSISMEGNLQITETLNGPINFLIEANQCTLDMKTCTKLISFNIKNCCEKLKETKMFYSQLIQRVIPRMLCPVKPGKYTVQRSDVDLSAFSRMPFDGSIYIFHIKILTTDTTTKERIVATCFRMQFKIIKVRV